MRHLASGVIYFDAKQQIVFGDTLQPWHLKYCL